MGRCRAGWGPGRRAAQQRPPPELLSAAMLAAAAAGLEEEEEETEEEKEEAEVGTAAGARPEARLQPGMPPPPRLGARPACAAPQHTTTPGESRRAPDGSGPAR